MARVQVVFGASGGAGAAVVRALAARGAAVRAVTRHGARDLPAGVENLRADAGDPRGVERACAGAEVVYHCVNVPYGEWERALPGVLDNLVAAAGAAGAKLVYCDNLYMYGPPEHPMDEGHPAAASGRKGQLRAQLAERLLAAHREGRVRATIGRASDFFGPAARNTVAGQLVFPALAAAKRPRWLGSLDVPHTLNYVDDVARELITLGSEEGALGEVWHLPAAPALTGREFLELACEVAGQPARAGVYPRWMLRLAGLFDRQMREVLEVLYQFERPFVLDASRFVAAFGDPGVTPLREAVARTLAWQLATAQA